jgi:dTDP-4-dehydrorhamnose 3,5-epimerase
VQDNHSSSAKGVLRGLHYQSRSPQGKLVRVIRGRVFDVAVDIRKGSSTYGKWISAILTAENFRMLWVPVGFAHGFIALEDYSEVLYKTTDYYHPEWDAGIRWDDPELAIQWPCAEYGIKNPIVSDKDATLPYLKDIDSSFVYLEDSQ